MGVSVHMYSLRGPRPVGWVGVGGSLSSLAGPGRILLQQPLFGRKEVLLPSDRGHGLAHQESSPTVQKSSFQDPLLAKGRQR